MPAIREGLAARLATIRGLRASAYMLPRPEPPAACVLPRDATFDVTMHSDDLDLSFDCWIYCSATDIVKAQQDIDEYLAPIGARSFRAAIYGDSTLGGIVADTTVVGWSSYASLMDVAGSKLLGASLQVRVEG